MKPSKNQRKKEIFYERLADKIFTFSDGKTLKVNKTLLSIESSIFEQLFSASEDLVSIDDFDLSTFKLFLDCLLGFQDFSVEDALLIFPIAWKYETQELIDKCLEILKPTVLNENVCLSLNIALFYKCDKLFHLVLKFLYERELIFKLLDEQLYCEYLEPESMLEILKLVELDSYMLINVINWGKHYLKKRKKLLTLKEFFTQEKIIDFVNFSCFETAASFLDFSKTKIGKEFFTDTDFRMYVEEYGYDDRKIKWVKVKAGEILTEKFIIKSFGLSKKYVTKLKFHRNKLVFFDVVDLKDNVLASYEIVGKLLECHQEGDNVAFRRRFSFMSNRKLCCCFKSFQTLDIVSDVEVEVKINFNYDCRICLSTPKNVLPVDTATEKFFVFYKWEIFGHEKNI